jgi:hypothetical protein
MYKHILIPTDGSALSEKAIRQGVALAKSINAKVTVLTVLPRFRTLAVDPFVMAETPDKYEQHCNERAQRYLAFAEMTANSTGVPYNGVHVIEDHPYQPTGAAGRRSPPRRRGPACGRTTSRRPLRRSRTASCGRRRGGSPGERGRRPCRRRCASRPPSLVHPAGALDYAEGGLKPVLRGDPVVRIRCGLSTILPDCIRNHNAAAP